MVLREDRSMSKGLRVRETLVLLGAQRARRDEQRETRFSEGGRSKGAVALLMQSQCSPHRCPLGASRGHSGILKLPKGLSLSCRNGLPSRTHKASSGLLPRPALFSPCRVHLGDGTGFRNGPRLPSYPRRKLQGQHTTEVQRNKFKNEEIYNMKSLTVQNFKILQ